MEVSKKVTVSLIVEKLSDILKKSGYSTRRFHRWIEGREEYYTVYQGDFSCIRLLTGQYRKECTLVFFSDRVEEVHLDISRSKKGLAEIIEKALKKVERELYKTFKLYITYDA
jgi:hypothetical protein